MIKYIFFIGFVFLFSTTIFSQSCGTSSLEKQLDAPFKGGEEIGKISRALKPAKRSSLQKNLTFDVQFWVITDGEDYVPTKAQIDTSLARVNFLFRGSNVNFKHYRNPIFVYDPTFLEFNTNQESVVYKKYRKKKVINIYVFGSIESADSKNIEYTGYTYHPLHQTAVYQQSTIYLSYEGVLEQSTIAHELGHFFGLFHTHENYGTDRAERVSRRGCGYTGDYLCDTPADPYIRSSVNALTGECQYTGNAVDIDGAFYEPMVSNIMSYATPSCRTEFTVGQSRVIWNMALLERTNLKHKIAEFTPKGFSLDRQPCLNLRCAEQRMVSKNGPQKAIVFIYQKEVLWCQQMLDELLYSSKYNGIFKDYILVIFEVEQNRSEIIDFLNLAVFNQSHIDSKDYKLLHTHLEAEVVRYPAVIAMDLWNHMGGNKQLEKRISRGGYQINYVNFGYLKPREFVIWLENTRLIAFRN